MSQEIQTVNINGSDLSGSNPNKTYGLTIPSGFEVVSNSLRIQSGRTSFNSQTDFSFTTPTITFSGVSFLDADEITIIYTIEKSVVTPTVTLNFTSVLGFVNNVKSLMKIPNADTASEDNTRYGANGIEILGTGDNSRLIFFLNNPGVIEETLTLSFGADEFNRTDLTETTDYNAIILINSIIDPTHFEITKTFTNTQTGKVRGTTFIGSKSQQLIKNIILSSCMQ